MIETGSFRFAINSEPEQNQRGPPVFKTGAFNHSATHPYEIAGKVSYRETINIRKRETVDRGGR